MGKYNHSLHYPTFILRQSYVNLTCMVRVSYVFLCGSQVTKFGEQARVLLNCVRGAEQDYGKNTGERKAVYSKPISSAMRR